MMLGIAVAMLVMNPKLALAVLAVMPVLAWVSPRAFRSASWPARGEVRRTNSRITAAYNEAIMGVLTSKAFVREKPNLTDFRQLTGPCTALGAEPDAGRHLRADRAHAREPRDRASRSRIGGFDLLGGVISAGTLVAFMAYARTFFDPVEQLGRWFAEMQMAQASAERILSLIETEPEIQDSPEYAGRSRGGRYGRCDRQPVRARPRRPVASNVSSCAT